MTRKNDEVGLPNFSAGSPASGALKILLLALALGAVFCFVYSPHFNNPLAGAQNVNTPFPIHYDEWRHIDNALHIDRGGGLPTGANGLELGFDYFLALVGKFTNLILAYRFFPAIWAVLTALVLFFVTYRLTNKNFLVALAAVLFFGSIKSDNNLTGLWFFTPLTFAIPFIYLYVYFFIRGLREEKRKYILASSGIMALLLPFHALAVSFVIPILFFTTLCYTEFIGKHWKFFLLFLAIPLVVLGFYGIVMHLSLGDSFSRLLTQLQFPKYWAGSGVAVLDNTLTEAYPFTGYLFAILGGLSILLRKKKGVELPKFSAGSSTPVLKDLSIYLIWPLYLLLAFILYKISGVSYFAPSVRNLYYLAIGLPFLSALGLGYLLELVKKFVGGRNMVVAGTVMVAIMVFVYFPYYVPARLPLLNAPPPAYTTMQLAPSITSADYRVLSHLAEFPPGNLIVPVAMYFPAAEAITGKSVLGSPWDNSMSSHTMADIFVFYFVSCKSQAYGINAYHLAYIFSNQRELNCGYILLSSDGTSRVYQAR